MLLLSELGLDAEESKKKRGRKIAGWWKLQEARYTERDKSE